MTDSKKQICYPTIVVTPSRKMTGVGSQGCPKQWKISGKKPPLISNPPSLNGRPRFQIIKDMMNWKQSQNNLKSKFSPMTSSVRYSLTQHTQSVKKNDDTPCEVDMECKQNKYPVTRQNLTRESKTQTIFAQPDFNSPRRMSQERPTGVATSTHMHTNSMYKQNSASFEETLEKKSLDFVHPSACNYQSVDASHQLASLQFSIPVHPSHAYYNKWNYDSHQEYSNLSRPEAPTCFAKQYHQLQPSQEEQWLSPPLTMTHPPYLSYLNHMSVPNVAANTFAGGSDLAKYEPGHKEQVESGLRGKLRAFEEEVKRLKKENIFNMMLDSLTLLKDVLEEREKLKKFYTNDCLLHRTAQILNVPVAKLNIVSMASPTEMGTPESPSHREDNVVMALCPVLLNSVLREGTSIRQRLANGEQLSQDIFFKYVSACQEMRLPEHLDRLVRLSSELEGSADYRAEGSTVSLDFVQLLKQAVAWKHKYDAIQQRVHQAAGAVFTLHSLTAETLHATLLHSATKITPPQSGIMSESKQPDVNINPRGLSEERSASCVDMVKQCTQQLLHDVNPNGSKSRKQTSSHQKPKIFRFEPSVSLELIPSPDNIQKYLAFNSVLSDCEDNTEPRTHGEGSECQGPTGKQLSHSEQLEQLQQEITKSPWKVRIAQLHEALTDERAHAKKVSAVYRAVDCCRHETRRRLDKLHKVEEILHLIDSKQRIEDDVISRCFGENSYERDSGTGKSKSLSLLDYVTISKNNVPDHVKGAVVCDVAKELRRLHLKRQIYKFVTPHNIITEDGFRLRPVELASTTEPLPPWRFLAPELPAMISKEKGIKVPTLPGESDSVGNRERNSCGDVPEKIGRRTCAVSAGKTLSEGCHESVTGCASSIPSYSADIYSLGQVVLWLSCLGRQSDSLSESLMSSLRELPVLNEMISADPSLRPSIDYLLQQKWFGYRITDLTDFDCSAGESFVNMSNSKKGSTSSVMKKPLLGLMSNLEANATFVGNCSKDENESIKSNCNNYLKTDNHSFVGTQALPVNSEFACEGYKAKMKVEEEAIIKEMDSQEDYDTITRASSVAEKIIIGNSLKTSLTTKDFFGFVECDPNHPFGPLLDTHRTLPPLMPSKVTHEHNDNIDVREIRFSLDDLEGQPDSFVLNQHEKSIVDEMNSSDDSRQVDDDSYHLVNGKEECGNLKNSSVEHTYKKNLVTSLPKECDGDQKPNQTSAATEYNSDLRSNKSKQRHRPRTNIVPNLVSENSQSIVKEDRDHNSFVLIDNGLDYKSPNIESIPKNFGFPDLPQNSTANSEYLKLGCELDHLGPCLFNTDTTTLYSTDSVKNTCLKYNSSKHFLQGISVLDSHYVSHEQSNIENIFHATSKIQDTKFISSTSLFHSEGRLNKRQRGNKNSVHRQLSSDNVSKAQLKSNTCDLDRPGYEMHSPDSLEASLLQYPEGNCTSLADAHFSGSDEALQLEEAAIMREMEDVFVAEEGENLCGRSSEEPDEILLILDERTCS